MLESKLEQLFKDYALGFGCCAYKFVSPGRRGVPDRLVIGPGGVAFFIEFKSTRGKLSPSQTREIGRLRQSGFRVYVCTNLEDAKETLHNELSKTK